MGNTESKERQLFIVVILQLLNKREMDHAQTKALLT